MLDEGSTTYNLVSAVALLPHVGDKMTLGGTYDGDALFVRELTLGAIQAKYHDGAVSLSTTGPVEQVAGGYQVTVEGVSFTLVGSDQLGQVVGQVAAIEGELLGTVVALTKLSTAQGEISIEPPPPDASVPPPPDADPGSWADD